jgi:hypothetical protein
VLCRKGNYQGVALSLPADSVPVAIRPRCDTRAARPVTICLCTPGSIIFARRSSCVGPACQIRGSRTGHASRAVHSQAIRPINAIHNHRTLLHQVVQFDAYHNPDPESFLATMARSQCNVAEAHPQSFLKRKYDVQATEPAVVIVWVSCWRSLDERWF